MTKDPVCGMIVDEQKTAATASYGGRTFYFCCSECKSKFDKDPQKYADHAEHSGRGCGCH